MAAGNNSLSRFVRVPDAAAFLSVSRGKIYQMMRERKLAYAQFGRSRRIPREALIALAKRSIVGDCDLIEA
jgi:excisionase family DNA binding protein